ncbi:MAG: MFS transporter [Candidatus Omnitrophota bacterium]
MIPLFVSAFLQNTGMTIVLIGVIFYAIGRFEASLFQLGILSGLGAFVFMAGAKSTKYLAHRFSPKQLTLFGGFLFALISASFPFLPSLSSLFWVYPFASLAIALFWPSLENWILLESDSNRLKQNVSFYNLSWSPGQIIAPFAAGWLFERGMALPIWAGVLVTVPVFFLLKAYPLRACAERSRSAPKIELKPQPSSGGPPSKFLITCWLSNVAAWFAAAIFRNLFPKYGLTLGLSPSTIGAFLLLIGIGQVLFFFLLGRFHGWENKPNFLFFWEAAAILALLAIAVRYQPLLWAVSFFAFGCFAGVAYSASLFVSLKERGPHGGGASSHEALIGMGIFLGPIVGGSVGRYFGVQAPYVAAAVVVGAVLLVQYWLLRNR